MQEKGIQVSDGKESDTTRLTTKLPGNALLIEILNNISKMEKKEKRLKREEANTIREEMKGEDVQRPQRERNEELEPKWLLT